MMGERIVGRLVRRLASKIQALQRDERNVEAFLAAVLQRSHRLTELHDPAGFVEFLRGCFERVAVPVKGIKADAGPADPAARRFATLTDAMRTGLAPIDVERAERMAWAADRLGSLSQPLEQDAWAGDVGWHFRLMSSLGQKGRLLSNVVRFLRSERCLELGTGYGMSAMFMLEAMKANGVTGHLATLEARDPQFSIASEMLKRQYGGMVSCHRGSTREGLPDLVRSLGRLDLLFHDARHTRRDYIADFEAVEPALVQGAVVLFDNIRWDDPRFETPPARTYEGWLAVVRHRRVRQAVETVTSDAMGLLLLR